MHIIMYILWCSDVGRLQMRNTHKNYLNHKNIRLNSLLKLRSMPVADIIIPANTIQFVSICEDGQIDKTCFMFLNFFQMLGSIDTEDWEFGVVNVNIENERRTVLEKCLINGLFSLTLILLPMITHNVPNCQCRTLNNVNFSNYNIHSLVYSQSNSIIYKVKNSKHCR